MSQVCAPCEACDLPSTGYGAEAKFVTGTMDAEITCLDDMVVEPGSDKQSKVISCIEGGQWNSDVPVCSSKSHFFLNIFNSFTLGNLYCEIPFLASARVNCVKQRLSW